ncbi:A/G-specific adenine glycosylase, partial [Colletotrichum asianum]
MPASTPRELKDSDLNLPRQPHKALLENPQRLSRVDLLPHFCRHGLQDGRVVAHDDLSGANCRVGHDPQLFPGYFPDLVGRDLRRRGRRTRAEPPRVRVLNQTKISCCRLWGCEDEHCGVAVEVILDEGAISGVGLWAGAHRSMCPRRRPRAFEVLFWMIRQEACLLVERKMQWPREVPITLTSCVGRMIWRLSQ